MKLDHSHQRISLFSKIIKDQAPAPLKEAVPVEPRVECLVKTLLADCDEAGNLEGEVL